MPSIINGLFSGRSGIASHGAAIAVVGDNISNSSTIGYKASRSEFEDLIAGGQTAGKTVGSGSSLSAVTTIFSQGTAEFTGRNLDLAIDGNGFFTVANGNQRYYTRAGNFRVDSAGFIVDQNGYAVMGFPSGGSGGLQPVNVNTVSQDGVATTAINISANLDASAATVSVASVDALGITAPAAAPPSTTTYTQVNALAQFSTTVDTFDTLGAAHSVKLYFFHTASNEYTVRGYVDSDEITGDTAVGLPRQILSGTLAFGTDGSLTSVTGTTQNVTVPWDNGSDEDAEIDFAFAPMTQFASPSNILAVTQDGKGIGTVGNFTISSDGSLFALLSNGQSAIVGQIGLTNFASPEGLTRIGKNLLQQSPTSGEPIVGKPAAGAFGQIKSGSLELSTVDIANEFVKLITLQRGFQANSRIITTINQLLNEIIQLA